jgi:hypothetical protein
MSYHQEIFADRHEYPFRLRLLPSLLALPALEFRLWMDLTSQRGVQPLHRILKSLLLVRQFHQDVAFAVQLAQLSMLLLMLLRVDVDSEMQPA